MTIHSKDGQTWQTKLKRIGELSAENKEIVFNNLGHLLSEKMLTDLYYELDANKAKGMDRVTKEDYGESLYENVKNLVSSLRKGVYHPKPVRIVEIPKENGDTRPLAISCFEDKLVQLCISKILNTIYEPLFLPCSYGFRPSQSCHDALKALNAHMFQNWDSACVEIDIRSCFNTIPHDALLDFLQRKISDKRLIKLILIIMRPQIMEGEMIVRNTKGCPQGSIVSPVLANIFLHYVIDDWFNSLQHEHLKGYAAEVRYADDMVFVFGDKQEAERFYAVLPKRLQKYGLEMNLEKSQLLAVGHNAAVRAHAQGRKLPTFKFLGFTCYWGKGRKGYWRLKYTSRQDRFTAKLKGLKNYLQQNLNTPNIGELFNRVNQVVRGWINYHGISDNYRRVSAFIYNCKRIIYKWFQRRGRKHSPTWEKVMKYLEKIGFPKKWKAVSMFTNH